MKVISYNVIATRKNLHSLLRHSYSCTHIHHTSYIHTSYFINPGGEICPLHLTHPKLVRNSGQPQCSARGPTLVLMPVPWSRGNDRSIECMSFDVGGNRSTRRKPTQTRGEHANSTQKGRDSNPGPSCCEATALTTAPPCCQTSYSIIHIKEVYE